MKKINLKTTITKSSGSEITLNHEFSNKNYTELSRLYFSENKKNERYSQRRVLSLDHYDIEPGPIFDVLDVIKQNFRIPPDSKVDIIIDLANRCAVTEYPAPKSNTAMRVLLNYNCKDQYHILGNRKKYLTENQCLGLGPAPLCPQTIKVFGRPMYKIDLPNGKRRTTIKPRNYKRMTIIFDFYVSDQFCSLLEKEIKDIDERHPIGKITKQAWTQIIRDYRLREKIKMDKVKKELQDI
jgi:hypothetical protein